MQGLYLGLQVFSAYGLIIMNLILLFGAGILFFKTKSTYTSMVFFGLLISNLAPLAVMVMSKISLPASVYLVFSLVAPLAAIVSAIGFLLYAKSLPKNTIT